MAVSSPFLTAQNMISHCMLYPKMPKMWIFPASMTMECQTWDPCPHSFLLNGVMVAILLGFDWKSGTPKIPWFFIQKGEGWKVAHFQKHTYFGRKPPPLIILVSRLQSDSMDLSGHLQNLQVANSFRTNIKFFLKCFFCAAIQKNTGLNSNFQLLL